LDGFSYPLTKTWIYASIAIIVITVIFAFLILNNLILLLIYAVFTAPLTIAIFAYKFHVYLHKKSAFKHASENQRRVLGIDLRKNWKLVFASCLLLSVIVLSSPFFLLNLSFSSFGGLIAVILMCGFATAANVSEIFLYIYFQQNRKKKT